MCWIRSGLLPQSAVLPVIDFFLVPSFDYFRLGLVDSPKLTVHHAYRLVNAAKSSRKDRGKRSVVVRRIVAFALPLSEPVVLLPSARRGGTMNSTVVAPI